MNFETIKGYYEKGLWNKAMVEKAVSKGIITQEQYNEITSVFSATDVADASASTNRNFGSALSRFIFGEKT